MPENDTILLSNLSDNDMNETVLINYIKQNIRRGLSYIDDHNIDYARGLKHSMCVMDDCLQEYKKEKIAKLKRVWANSNGPLEPVQPMQDLNTTINLISRVSNIAGRVDLIRKIANEYEDHIDDVLDELDELLNYLFENLND